MSQSPNLCHMIKPTPALVALALLLAGCTPAPAQVVTVTATAVATPASPTPEPTVNGWDNAQKFAEATAKSNYADARPYAAEGGAAARYLTHMEAITEALAAAGQSEWEAPEAEFDADAKTVTLNYDDGSDVVWKDFEYDAAGKVLSWATGESSTKLSDRLWTKSAKVATKHATVELVSAYKNDAGLWIVLDITAKSRAISPDCSAMLVDSKKRQREAGECDGPDRISKGSAGYVALVFPKAEFGGTLRYVVQDDDYNELATIKLKIR